MATVVANGYVTAAAGALYRHRPSGSTGEGVARWWLLLLGADRTRDARTCRVADEATRSAPASSVPTGVGPAHGAAVDARDLRRRADVSKQTFQPNNRRRKKKHGFRLRMRTRAGRAIVRARRSKGRARLTA